MINVPFRRPSFIGKLKQQNCDLHFRLNEVDVIDEILPRYIQIHFWFEIICFIFELPDFNLLTHLRAGDAYTCRWYVSALFQVMTPVNCQAVNSLWLDDTMWRQKIWVNIGPGNGLVPYGTKPLPKPISSNHKWGSLALAWQQHCNECLA